MTRRKRRLSTGLRLLLVLLVIGAAAGGAWWLWGRDRAPQMPEGFETFTEEVKVTRGTLRATVEVVGELAPVKWRNLAFSRAGGTVELLEVLVEPGNAVRQGDVIARIAAKQFEQDVDRARAALSTAEKQLADVQKSVAPEQVAAADLAVARAGLDLADAKETLAKLEAPDLARLRDAVQDAADELTLAKLELTLAEHGLPAKAVRDLRYAIGWHDRRAEELRAKVESGQANLEETQELAAERQAVTETRGQLAEAEAAQRMGVTAARQAITTAEQALARAQRDLDEAGGSTSAARTLELRKARLAVAEAGVELDEAREVRRKLDEGPDPQAAAAAETEVQRLRLALSEAELALQETTLTAPYAGTLLTVEALSGEYIGPETTVAVLADLSRLEISAYVDETLIRDIVEGQRAEVRFDAQPGKVYAAEVKSVPLQGTLQSDVMVYTVRLALEEASELELLVGMNATVRIETGTVEDALLVPAMAVQREVDATYVLTPDPSDPNAPPIPTPVETGLSNDLLTEIVSGLAEGDTVFAPLQTEINGPMRGVVGG